MFLGAQEGQQLAQRLTFSASSEQRKPGPQGKGRDREKMKLDCSVIASVPASKAACKHCYERDK